MEILNLDWNKIININVLERVNFKNLKKLNLIENEISTLQVFQKAQFGKLENLNVYGNLFNKENESTIINSLKEKIKYFFY